MKEKKMDKTLCTGRSPSYFFSRTKKSEKTAERKRFVKHFGAATGSTSGVSGDNFRKRKAFKLCFKIVLCCDESKPSEIKGFGLSTQQEPLDGKF